MRCTALGLNKNCPRGIIHGPPLLGGMGIPSPHQKITKDRINYFLYNIRWKSDIHQQLNISIIYSQIEVGLFHQFFAIPFNWYGHLATQSFCVQIWRKNEPFGLQVHPSSNSTWIPSPTSPGDRALMEFATLSYNMKGSSMKNRCRIYLQLFSVCDLLIYKTSTIHPSYYKGVLPPSRESSNLSPNVPRPPQWYWSLWSHVLHFVVPNHITPFVPITCYRWVPLFFKHTSSPHLYSFQNGEATMFRIQISAWSRFKAFAT